MNYKVFDDSRNYTAQVIKLPNPQPVPGLDRLVNVCVQGNNCLVGKDTDFDEVHLFFCSETVLSQEFLSKNNLYRHSELNEVKDRKGFFEDNGRVKAVKFKGVVSSGFVIPLTALANCGIDVSKIKIGDEFNAVDGVEVCKKFIRHAPQSVKNKQKVAKVLDEVVDSRMAPEHFDTSHLSRNLHKFTKDTDLVILVKMHGTSCRVYNTLVKRKLRWFERLAKWCGVKVQEEEYNYVAASRRVIKSVGFEELPGKNHFYSLEDLWSRVSKEHFDGKLLQGEAVYFEIVGKTYGGKDIQPHYNYGFDRPKVFIYRISHINPHGVEVDLTYEQMKVRAEQLGLEVCKEVFCGKLGDFVAKYTDENLNLSNEQVVKRFEEIVYTELLEKPSYLDPTRPEEGVCIRTGTYPKPEIFKAKAKAFLEYESKSADAGEVDTEEQEAIL